MGFCAVLPHCLISADIVSQGMQQQKGWGMDNCKARGEYRGMGEEMAAQNGRGVKGD